MWLIRLISIPDGLATGDERNDTLKLTKSILKVLPGHFEDLIEKINQSNDDDQISCIIADTIVGVNYYVKQCNWLLCNSFYELDSPACDLIPGIIPVAPLLLGNQSGSHAGSFWPQDSICLSWLDEQPMGSVIYVAFGSTATFSQQQFDEIALGLELIGQPFLWVVRSGITDGPPAEFLHVFRSRTNNRGMVVDWAPQEKVLDHLILHVL
nr:UDP-glycosyltransferase 83A1-like [Quercus suber]